MDSRGTRIAISPRGFIRWALAHSQALVLFFFLALFAAVVFWFFAFFVTEGRKEAIGEWRRDLSVTADGRRDLLERSILDETEQASFVATFPTVRELVSSARNAGSGEEPGAHVGGILSNFRTIFQERSISILNGAGDVLVSSDGPAPEAEPIALAREAMRSGAPRVDLVREPDGSTSVVFAVPVVRASENADGAAAGAVLVVGSAREIFGLLERPARSGRSAEVFLVRRDEESILFLSPLLFRKDAPLTFRQPLDTIDFVARAALAGEDSYSTYVDYRNERVLGATRRLKSAPWSLVVKVDEDEALSAFREDVRRRGLMWGGLLLALMASAFGTWRSLVASHEVKLARSEKRAEENVVRLNARLEEALAWQRQIFEGSRDAVFVSDEEARFVSVNGAATELTGYAREELLKMGIPDLHEEPDLAAYRAFHQRILAGEQILSEAPIRKKDGSKVAVEFNNRVVTIGGRRFMHTAGRDVTERKQLEAQLVQAQKMEAVGRLAGGVAHDFNNLLTVIQGYAELLGPSLANDPERGENLGEIVRAAERAAALTHQLLAFSRRQVLETRVLDLGAVVADTEKMLRRLIGEDIEVVVVRPATLGRVRADPGQVEQVLLNLAVNSRDAMPEGGRLTIELADVNLDAPFTASHDSIPPGRYVVVSVRDTGIGMDAETLGHLFEPFFTTKEKGKGTGLGLATVFGIIKQSGGYVDVASAPGTGTTFHVYLPRSASQTTSGVRPRVSSRPGSETVLVVEDEAAVRNLVRAVLERTGYLVLAAEDGAAALELVEKHAGAIHVLLTDVVMPGMNGRDLAARVRARRPAIKVVFMSGYTADVPADFGMEGGPAFLSKPFNDRALTLKLREVLDTTPT